MVIEQENKVEENLNLNQESDESTVVEDAHDSNSLEEVSEESPTVEKAQNSNQANLPFVIGRKVGMTRIFDENGTDFPATVISAGPCIITQIKTLENDGYYAYQLGLVESKVKMNKPIGGHVKKASDNLTVSHFQEIRVESLDDTQLGSEINANIFEIGDLVTVKGVSKGRGFAGHMKRHNFGGGRKSHGKNSVMRKAGSVGAGTDPGKVWKGTRMAGQMGNDSVTVKNLEIIRLDIDNNLVFIRGAIPGANNGLVYLMR